MANKPEKFPLRVRKGYLEPADEFAVRRLREKGYSVGDILHATLSKPRNPRFWRLAHVFGQLVADNIEDFTGMDSHRVLKRIQLEAGIACDEMLLRADNGMQFIHRLPQSLSFASMDEGQFREVFRAMAEHIACKYWPDMTAEEIEVMTEAMPNAA